MLGFAHSKKPDAVKAQGPKERDDVSPPIPAISQAFTPPVIRNFSYPTSVSSGTGTSTRPIESGIRRSCYNLLPENILNLDTLSLEDPIFQILESAHDLRLTDQDAKFQTPPCVFDQSIHQVHFKGDISEHKRRRRSALLGLPFPQSQDIGTPPVKPASCAPQPDETKVQNSHWPEGDILEYRTGVIDALKKNSLGQHNPDKSLDVSNSLHIRVDELVRPVSSSGGPSIDTRTSTLMLVDNKPITTRVDKKCIPVTIDSMGGSLSEETQKFSPKPGLGVMHCKSSSRDAAVSENKNGDVDVSSESNERKAGRGKWFSQIKEWITTAEPSTQALKNYKKDAFKRAGTTPNDPLATAKLRIPSTTLPPEAIRPCGPGLDPEEVAKMKAEKRRLRQSFQTTTSSSGGSRSSASQHSSLINVPLREAKGDT